jgi:hypothetical protein
VPTALDNGRRSPRKLLRAARGLGRLPLTSSDDGKGNQENDDSDGTDDACDHGNETRNVAGVGPDEADNRSDDEQGDHRG